ncbi:MAG: hypothetical protein HZY76_03360 [Anaerolineae bacterium]|nr:MAG: hypothetical protein HZY76_03360 [Anaerolineae bacterium]
MTTLNCVDPTPDDNSWACTWQPGSLAGLTGFDLRARASDRFGNTSAGPRPPPDRRHRAADHHRRPDRR